MARGIAALLAALTFTEAATAVYVPSLHVGQVSNGVEVSIQTEADDATERLLAYVPGAYTSTHATTPAGTTVGRVSARVEVRAVAPGLVFTFLGTVVADSPANHVSNMCAPGLHQAVWIATLNVPGQPRPIRISVYVDVTAGAPDSGLGAIRLQACLPSPDVPESQGGAPLGTKLREMTFTLERIFTTRGSGVFQWVGRFVPYVPGTSTPNTAGTVESYASVRFPGRVTLRGRRITRAGRHVAVLTGAVTETSRGVPRAFVRITGGGRIRSVTTRSNGRFSMTVLLTRTTTFRADASVRERDVTTAVCPPCVSARVAGFQASSAAVRIAVPPPKRKR